MNALFYIAGAVALAATGMVITRRNAAHAALYLVVALLALALIFYLLGAPFVAALEVIVYAGAIMVLFIFVIMMLNLGTAAVRQESAWLQPRAWRGPALLVLLLAAEMIYALWGAMPEVAAPSVVDAKQTAVTLFTRYALGVELASFLLLAGLIGAYHLGFRPDPGEGECG